MISTLRTTSASAALAALLCASASRAQVTNLAVIESYGAPCGPALSATDSIPGRGLHSMNFSVRGAAPNMPVGLFFGASQLDLPLPLTSCRLLVDSFSTMTGTASSRGAASFPLILPAAAEGRFFAQAVSLDFSQPTITSSNGLDILLTGRSPTLDPTVDETFPCHYIENLNWNYGGDGVPLVRGKVRWPSSTCSFAGGPDAGRPIMIFMHGNGMDNEDHDYLMAHLARNGIVTASISNGAHMSGTNEGRARQAISYLNSMFAFWGFRDRLNGQVVFAGHSRGGEAAVTAARLLREQPSLAHAAYDVRAVVSIAPTDGGGSISDPRESLTGQMTRAFLAIYGSRDPDVRGIRLGDPIVAAEETPFAIYDRAGTESSTEGFLLPQSNITKSLIYVERATHLGFSESCASTILSPLSCDKHQSVARGYINAFLRWRLFGEGDYQAYFDGRATPNTVSIEGTRTDALFSQPRKRVIDNFEQGGLGQNTTGDTVTTNGVISIAENEAYLLEPTMPHDTRAMRVRWADSSSWVRWGIAAGNVSFVGPRRDLSPFDFVSIRVAQEYRWGSNVPGEEQDFSLSVFSPNSGHSDQVAVSDYSGGVPAPDPFVTYPIPFPQGDYTKSAMKTIRIPLSAFGNVDWTNVRSVYLRFNQPGHETGSVIVDSLEFVD